MPIPIRTSAKAIVVHEGRVLLVRMQDGESHWYAFPGGGQLHGEPLNQTVIRECSEETGFSVHAGPLVHIREYISANHEFAAHDSEAHQVEFWFLCTVDGTPAGLASELDPLQVDHVWVDVSHVADNFNIYPRAAIGVLRAIGAGHALPVYLGDVN